MPRPCPIPYSGKFSRGPNFRDFRDQRPKRENKNREIRSRENLNTNFWKFLPRTFCALVSLDLTSDDGTIVLFQTRRDVLPFPTGHLSFSVSPATIRGRGQ